MTAKVQLLATASMAIVLGIVLGASVHVATATGGSARAHTIAHDEKKAAPVDPAVSAAGCQMTSSMGTVLALRAGYDASAISTAGYKTLPFLSNANGTPAVGTSSLVFVPARMGTDPTKDAASLERMTQVSASGLLRPQSANPDLHTCAYDLSDRPKARALADVAVHATSAIGLLKSQPLMYLVSDYPLAPNEVVVTLDQDGGVSGYQPGPLGGPLHSYQPLAVLMTLDGGVLAMGTPPW